MAEDRSALIQAVNALRTETNTALGELTPRNARRIVDRLRPEREATNRLVLMLLDEIKETREFMEKFNQKAELVLHTSPNDPETRH